MAAYDKVSVLYCLYVCLNVSAFWIDKKCECQMFDMINPWIWLPLYSVGFFVKSNLQGLSQPHKRLRSLADFVPYGLRRKSLFEVLIRNNVPLLRATWFIKVTYLNQVWTIDTWTHMFYYNFSWLCLMLEGRRLWLYFAGSACYKYLFGGTRQKSIVPH